MGESPQGLGQVCAFGVARTRPDTAPRSSRKGLKIARHTRSMQRTGECKRVGQVGWSPLKLSPGSHEWVHEGTERDRPDVLTATRGLAASSIVGAAQEGCVGSSFACLRGSRSATTRKRPAQGHTSTRARKGADKCVGYHAGELGKPGTGRSPGTLDMSTRRMERTALRPPPCMA